MPKRRRVLVALACLALLAGVMAALFMRDPGPSYKGKSLSRWLAECGPAPVYPRWAGPDTNQAAEALTHFGTNALPLMLEWITTGCEPPPPPITAKFLRRLPRFLVRFMPNKLPDLPRHEAAMTGFVILGEKAAPALPILTTELCSTNELRVSVSLYAISAIGTNGLPILLAYLQNDSARSRGNALMLLLEQDQLRTNAAPFLLPVMYQWAESSNADLKELASWALGRLDADPKRTVPLLIPQIEQSRDEMLAVVSMSTMKNFGADARDAIPAISTRLGDPAERVRKAATNALLKIAPEVLTNTPAQ